MSREGLRVVLAGLGKQDSLSKEILRRTAGNVLRRSGSKLDKRAGLELTARVHLARPDVRIVLQSSVPQNRALAEEVGASFLLKGSPVLLTQQPLVSSLPEHRATVVCLDSDWQAIAQQSQENPVSQVTGDNLAYVMYTSGSTGRRATRWRSSPTAR